MEVLSNSAGVVTISRNFSFKPHKTHQKQSFSTNVKLPNSPNKNYPFNLSFSSSSLNSCTVGISARTAATSFATAATSFTAGDSLSSSSSSSSSHSENRHWTVLMEAPPQGVDSKPEVIDYYVKTLEKVLGSEMDAQMCIYDASLRTHFGFCCDIDAETSRELACLPGVLSVRPDIDINSSKKDYSYLNVQLGHQYNPHIRNSLLFPLGNTKHWLVRMEKPGIGVVTKAQMADYYAQILAKVLGNEKDSQMCIYHISWKSNFGFCCELDEECAKDLAGIPGVLSVQPDENFDSENKNYGGSCIQNPTDVSYSAETSEIVPVETKKLFVTGLSFYTSEKTLRAAFEGFGELVEVKIIMDKISKRSKGYAFVEYTTKEAAGAALKEMNGKIINGWMIVVDVAKSSPRRYGQGRRRDEGSLTREMETRR